MFSASEIFDLAIRIEENGEYFYRKAAADLKEPKLMEMLHEIANDELRHREWFLKTKRSAGIGGIESLLSRLSGTFLQEAIEDHGFSLEEVDFSAISDERSLLEVAMGFEQDSITFYEILSGFVEDEQTRKYLEAIIEEEKGHVALLEERMNRLPG
ncbi:MAG: ferritin family protein [Deltaproteobacteria bacterium]|nr:ferritin family protein [Deltaproteobacteria bacterium]